MTDSPIKSIPYLSTNVIVEDILTLKQRNEHLEKVIEHMNQRLYHMEVQMTSEWREGVESRVAKLEAQIPNLVMKKIEIQVEEMIKKENR
jgi:hypothetical protein